MKGGVFWMPSFFIWISFQNFWLGIYKKGCCDGNIQAFMFTFCTKLFILKGMKVIFFYISKKSVPNERAKVLLTKNIHF